MFRLRVKEWNIKLKRLSVLGFHSRTSKCRLTKMYAEYNSHASDSSGGSDVNCASNLYSMQSR